MTATITLSCDQHRNGETCRGFLPTRALTPGEAREGEGKRAGWRFRLALVPGSNPARYRAVDECPSLQHDEQRGPYTSAPATRTEVVLP
jgi:hypothetical protein